MSILYQFRTKNFTVRCEDVEDDFDLSWDDTGECRAKLDSGEWQMFCAKVSVLFRGSVLATEYLGGCVHADPKEFIDHRGNAGKCGSYFTDMMTVAIDEARTALQNMPVIHPPRKLLLARVTTVPAVDMSQDYEGVFHHFGKIPPAGWEYADGGAYKSDAERRATLAP